MEEEQKEEGTLYEYITHPGTACEHYYVENGTDNGLKSVICSKCWSGMNIANDIEVKGGQILWNTNQSPL